MIKEKNIIINKNAYGECQSSLQYWENHRNKLDDLYPSERYFLEPALKNATSTLDVGCAGGGSYNFCKEANPDIDYTGIDISKPLLDIAKKSNPKGNFSQYNGHFIPFSKNRFDLVFSIGVLHHLNHWQNMILQMVKCSSKLSVFDLRLTERDTLSDTEKYYQKVSFDNKWDEKTAITYIVVNIEEFVRFLKRSFSDGAYRIESYGYFAKPTKLANIPYNKVFMCCIKVEKNDRYPGIFIDIPN